LYPKLEMNDPTIRAFGHPPNTPAECIFAQTTHSISADLKTQIGPCQFGGNPDCKQCGCIASMGLEALGRHRTKVGIYVKDFFRATGVVGKRCEPFAAQEGCSQGAAADSAGCSGSARAGRSNVGRINRTESVNPRPGF